MERGENIKNSQGRVGERAAEYWFNANGWKMERTQPEAKIIKVFDKGKYVVVLKKGGVADFTGYRPVSELMGHLPIYTACEVKEASGNSMPCSRLSKDQRVWLGSLPGISSKVGILWVDTGKFEVFDYKPKGSYERGRK